MPHMDLKRAGKLLREKNVEVLVASTQPNFYYASGYKPRVSERPMMVVVTADPNAEPAMIVGSFIERQAREKSKIVRDIRSYPMWVCQAPIEQVEKGLVQPAKLPEQFNYDQLYGMLSDIFAEKGVKNKTIALEQNLFAPQALNTLTRQNPSARFVSAESIFFELRKIKTGEEIKELRLSSDLSERGIVRMCNNCTPGVSISELQQHFRLGVLEAALDKGPLDLDFLHNIISAGDPLSAELPDRRVKTGDIIFIDCGIQVNGYNSDMGRTFVVGKPNDLQQKIFKALRAGYEDGVSRLRPGIKMSDIYKVIHQTVRKNGLPWFARGHVGHMVGIGVGPGYIEQPPFFSEKEKQILEPDMVITVEIGTYVTGFAAFQLEDMLLITPDGHESFTKLPRELVEIGV